MKKQKVSIRSSVNGVEYDVPFPLTYTNVNQWWTVSKGRGDYLGPSQMFGGPKTGDIIRVDGVDRPFYMLVTSCTQDWDTRRASGVVLCFCDQYWNKVAIDLQSRFEHEKEFVTESVLKYWGITNGFNMLLDWIRFRIHTEIELV